MKLPMVCLGALSLTGTIDVVQNDVKGMPQFMIVFLDLQKYQNSGVYRQSFWFLFHNFWVAINHISNITYDI